MIRSHLLCVTQVATLGYSNNKVSLDMEATYGNISM